MDLELCHDPPIEFIRILHPVVEVIYHLFLTTYTESIEAYYQKSLKTAKKVGVSKRVSTDNWYNSKHTDVKALQTAVEGAEKAKTDKAAANVAADTAWDFLKESVDTARGNATSDGNGPSRACLIRIWKKHDGVILLSVGADMEAGCEIPI